MFALVSWLRSHPIISTVLTAFLAVSAFTGGMMSSIGLSFIVIVDKPSMLLLLGFYGSLLALLLSVLRWAATYGWVTAKRDADLLGRPQDHKLWRLLRMTIIYGGGIMSAYLIVGAVFTLASDVPFSPPAFVSRLGFYFPHALGVIVGLGMVAFFGRLLLPPSNEREEPGVVLSLFHIGVLITAWAAGTVWVKFLMTDAPKSIVHIALEGPRLAALLLPATNGLILSFENDDIAHYIPWSVVERIDARAPALNPTESTSDKALPPQPEEPAGMDAVTP